MRRPSRRRLDSSCIVTQAQSMKIDAGCAESLDLGRCQENGEQSMRSKYCHYILTISLCAICSWMMSWWIWSYPTSESPMPLSTSLKSVNICGIVLGMAQNDVLRLTGHPKEVDGQFWRYGTDSSGVRCVEFDDDKRVVGVWGTEIGFRGGPQTFRRISRPLLRSLLGEPIHIEEVDLKWPESWRYEDAGGAIDMIVWFDRRPLFSGTRSFYLGYTDQKVVNP